MLTPLVLMLVQGVLGAFDTVYYHEYRARLVAGGRQTRDELLLHAARDFIYAMLFMLLPFYAFLDDRHGGVGHPLSLISCPSFWAGARSRPHSWLT